eukprot:TRINITY_DN56911_c0_g1_i1.p2 TRINITY_DN56911_c0_g1~~TRINITY_DN56911_c0_g1_i1.p2  ORF type:complete len:332 (+),score=46.95 TRINITY_DN56911_c0_g1_i1:124-996(+)
MGNGCMRAAAVADVDRADPETLISVGPGIDVGRQLLACGHIALQSPTENALRVHLPPSPHTAPGTAADWRGTGPYPGLRVSTSVCGSRSDGRGNAHGTSPYASLLLAAGASSLNVSLTNSSAEGAVSAEHAESECISDSSTTSECSQALPPEGILVVMADAKECRSITAALRRVLPPGGSCTIDYTCSTANAIEMHAKQRYKLIVCDAAMEKEHCTAERIRAADEAERWDPVYIVGLGAENSLDDMLDSSVCPNRLISMPVRISTLRRVAAAAGIDVLAALDPGLADSFA